MGVGDEDAEAYRLFAELGGERPTERADAGARIEYDNFASHAQFDAWGVAAVIDRFRSGCGNGAAHTPEFKPDVAHLGPPIRIPFPCKEQARRLAGGDSESPFPETQKSDLLGRDEAVTAGVLGVGQRDGQGVGRVGRGVAGKWRRRCTILATASLRAAP